MRDITNACLEKSTPLHTADEITAHVHSRGIRCSNTLRTHTYRTTRTEAYKHATCALIRTHNLWTHSCALTHIRCSQHLAHSYVQTHTYIHTTCAHIQNHTNIQTYRTIHTYNLWTHTYIQKHTYIQLVHSNIHTTSGLIHVHSHTSAAPTP